MSNFAAKLQLFFDICKFFRIFFYFLLKKYVFYDDLRRAAGVGRAAGAYTPQGGRNMARPGEDLCEDYGRVWRGLGLAYARIMGGFGADWGGLMRGLWEGLARPGEDLCEAKTKEKCNKMQKNCIFLQFYLHISKKSSTFVPDLGIILILTIKYIRVMKSLCLCRFMIGGKVLRLVERQEIGGRWSYYRIYDGRKRASGTVDYGDISAAYEAFQGLCFDLFNYKQEGGTL